MQGYIISVHRAKDEDTIVTLITQDYLYTLYRFYGARHSTINLGYKVDFEIESSQKTTISRLRHVLHLGFSWLRDKNRLLIWQQFVALFPNHLRDSTSLDSFYFNLLEECATIWHQQNPKRIVVEAYIRLLEFEGRLHNETTCFLCEKPLLEEEFTVIRAFLPAHATCAFKKPFSTKAIRHLYSHFDTIMLSDKDVERLYDTVLEGF